MLTVHHLQYAKGSYDFNDHVALPKPMLPEDRHGTRCAGEVAAVRNDVCGIGVAYDAKVSGTDYAVRECHAEAVQDAQESEQESGSCQAI